MLPHATHLTVNLIVCYLQGPCARWGVPVLCERNQWRARESPGLAHWLQFVGPCNVQDILRFQQLWSKDMWSCFMFIEALSYDILSPIKSQVGALFSCRRQWFCRKPSSLCRSFARRKAGWRSGNGSRCYVGRMWILHCFDHLELPLVAIPVFETVHKDWKLCFTAIPENLDYSA